MAVAADDDVDAWHCLRQAHVVAVAETPVLAFLDAAVAEAMTTSTFSVSRRIFTISLADSMGSENFTAPPLV